MPTEVGFNINFDIVPICEDCAMTIFIQQAQWLVKTRDVNKSRRKLEDKGKSENK